jgi:small subunit ribosomal protein S21
LSLLSDTSARSRLRARLFRQHFALADFNPITQKGCRVQVLVRDNNVDQALKALKKKMQREGIFREMKLRGHYEKPSEKKAREKAEAVRRARKLARKKLQREGLLPMKPKPVFGAGAGGDRGAAGGRGGPGAGPRGPR